VSGSGSGVGGSTISFPKSVLVLVDMSVGDSAVDPTAASAGGMDVFVSPFKLLAEFDLTGPASLPEVSVVKNSLAGGGGDDVAAGVGATTGTSTGGDTGGAGVTCGSGVICVTCGSGVTGVTGATGVTGVTGMGTVTDT
jgi:hypothetical protein